MKELTVTINVYDYWIDNIKNKDYVLMAIQDLKNNENRLHLFEHNLNEYLKG